MGAALPVLGSRWPERANPRPQTQSLSPSWESSLWTQFGGLRFLCLCPLGNIAPLPAPRAAAGLVPQPQGPVALLARPWGGARVMVMELLAGCVSIPGLLRAGKLRPSLSRGAGWGLG